MKYFIQASEWMPIFFRANDQKRRNKYWYNITKLTDWYSEIMVVDDDINYIKNKEIEFIKLYGRASDGGTLCNLTMGGEGTLGLKPANIKICFGLDPENNIFEFQSITDAARHLGDVKLNSNITNVCKGKTNNCGGWRFAYKMEDLFKPLVDLRGKNKSKPNSRSVKIYGRSPNGEIMEFPNPYYAAEHIGGHHTLVRKVAKGGSKHTKKWVFSYDKNTLR